MQFNPIRTEIPDLGLYKKLKTTSYNCKRKFFGARKDRLTQKCRLSRNKECIVATVLCDRKCLMFNEKEKKTTAK